jgi:hypothetical protein
MFVYKLKVKFNKEIFCINCIKPRKVTQQKGLKDHFTKARGTLVRQFFFFIYNLNWGKGQCNYQPLIGGRQFRLEIRACKPWTTPLWFILLFNQFHEGH